MNAQRSDILKLIYAAIKKEERELSSDFSIFSIFPTIKEHNIIALCYYGAIECGINESSLEMRSLFNYVCQYVYTSSQQDYIAKEIFSLFNEKHIEYMPLKGVLLREFYPYPEMRIMGDLDVLIKTEHYVKIKALLSEFEYSEIKETDHELIWSKN